MVSVATRCAAVRMNRAGSVTASTRPIFTVPSPSLPFKWFQMPSPTATWRVCCLGPTLSLARVRRDGEARLFGRRVRSAGDGVGRFETTKGIPTGASTRSAALPDLAPRVVSLPLARFRGLREVQICRIDTVRLIDCSMPARMERAAFGGSFDRSINPARAGFDEASARSMPSVKHILTDAPGSR